MHSTFNLSTKMNLKTSFRKNTVTVLCKILTIWQFNYNSTSFFSLNFCRHAVLKSNLTTLKCICLENVVTLQPYQILCLFLSWKVKQIWILHLKLSVLTITHAVLTSLATIDSPLTTLMHYTSNFTYPSSIVRVKWNYMAHQTLWAPLQLNFEVKGR